MEKGGLAAALAGAGLNRDDDVLYADELRLGLHGQVRRVLAPRGVKPVQHRQIEYRWAYLLLAVDPLAGALRWRWLERFRQGPLKDALAEWGAAAVVWDGAGPHRGKDLRELPGARIGLPPYAPELNPAERVFEEIRRRVEGDTYATLAAKQAEAEGYLRELAADPERVTSLCGWGWVVAALAALPAPADTPP